MIAPTPRKANPFRGPQREAIIWSASHASENSGVWGRAPEYIDLTTNRKVHFTLNQNSIRFPETIDLVTSKGNDCFLFIIQVDRFADQELPALQDKINNYLAFSLDGQLVSTYPNMANKHVTIKVQLSCDPTSAQQEFYSAVTKVCSSEGIGFEVEIPAHLRLLEQVLPTEGQSRRPWWRFW